MIGSKFRIARRIIPFMYPFYSPSDFWTLVLVVLIGVLIMLFFLVWIGYFEK